jgi:hypothetical protein
MSKEFAKNPKNPKGLKQPADGEILDAELAQVLGDFRLSVHAWSEAAYSRPRRALAEAPRYRVWRLATGWALGCVLVAGAVSGGVQVRHHKQQELARIATLKQAEATERQRLAAEEKDRDEELLAKVDSDVSQEIPSAMEPLTQLMAEDDSR